MNLFDLPPLPLSRELTTVLAQQKAVRIERIVSTGQTSGWYDQKEEEFVALLQGAATLEFADGKTVDLAAGDTLSLPAHTWHRVAFTTALPPCIWLCIFWR